MRSCSKPRACCEKAEGRSQKAENSRAHFCLLPSAFCLRAAAGNFAMIVIKFGGTSVGDADRVANAIDIVAERRDLDPIVVVSALAGVTNDLVAASEAARAQEPQRVATIIKSIRDRHEDVAMRLVQQKSDFFEA